MTGDKEVWEYALLGFMLVQGVAWTAIVATVPNVGRLLDERDRFDREAARRVLFWLVWPVSVPVWVVVQGCRVLADLFRLAFGKDEGS